MGKSRTYHGWIYPEKEAGFNEHYKVQYAGPKGESLVRSMGYSAAGAAAAVAFFEEEKVILADGTTIQGRKLGRISLEKTPLGYRVYTR